MITDHLQYLNQIDGLEAPYSVEITKFYGAVTIFSQKFCENSFFQVNVDRAV